jgi:antirestriction protein ArdC
MNSTVVIDKLPHFAYYTDGRVPTGTRPSSMARPEQTRSEHESLITADNPGSQPDVLARLEQAVATILNSEMFRHYLDVQARFHHYSFGNALLILLQRPDATQVAGFHAWRKLGRFVRKGEKGIKIVVPHVRRVGADDEEDVRRVTGFGVGTIFDIVQTDGEPLPTIEVPVLDGEDGQELYHRLAALAAAEGVALARRPAEAMPREVMGFYAPSTCSIVVREASPLQMAKTLAHELGHHYTGLTDATRSEHETVAESVAYIVCAHHGLDTGARSFPYVATWSQDTAVFKQALGNIQRVSARIIDALEQLPPPAAPEPEPQAARAPEPPDGAQFRLF